LFVEGRLHGTIFRRSAPFGRGGEFFNSIGWLPSSDIALVTCLGGDQHAAVPQGESEPIVDVPTPGPEM
jgi:hypothetical protein